jgi:predicted DsbA family dithiol-disulfide isomerase
VPLRRLFGPGIAQSQEGQRRRCEELGLPFTPPRLLCNSRLAIEAAEFAQEAGKHPEFHRTVLRAYFADSRDIGDVQVLSQLAAEVGLDPRELSAALTEGRYANARDVAAEEARSSGVTAVPTFVFAGGARVVGAQPLDRFRRVLENAEAGGSC